MSTSTTEPETCIDSQNLPRTPRLVTIEPVLGGWSARSTSLEQGTVSGSPEVVLATVAAWMRGEAG